MLLTLMSLLRIRDVLVGVVLALTESVPASNPLLRDACYRAIGRGCHEFKFAVNFTSWFHAQLAPLLTAPPTTVNRPKTKVGNSCPLCCHI